MRIKRVLMVLCLLVLHMGAHASLGAIASMSSFEESTGDRYGPFGLFDSRSMYGKGVFPEPFVVDDSDLEVNEIRFDWLHEGGKGRNTNVMTLEVEKGFGLWTVEVAAHYDYDTADRRRMQGFDNIDVGVRHPVYQFVSHDEWVDNTVGIGIEIGVPTNSPLSKNAEIVPKIFDDLRLGDHFTLQTLLGYSFLRGSRPIGGLQGFEYGFVFGYTLEREMLALPDVEQLIPVLELQGETLLNTHEAGSNTLVGNIGLRMNLQAIGRVQPRLGLGYIFPMDKGARQDFHWGVFTSLVFDF